MVSAGCPSRGPPCCCSLIAAEHGGDLAGGLQLADGPAPCLPGCCIAVLTFSAPCAAGSVIPQGTGITVDTLLGANLTVLNINNTNYVYSYGTEAGITGTYENA